MYNKGMEDSIFTKIIKGEIPCNKIYENDKVLAFLDIHPANTGHTLVVPKMQVEYVWDLPAEEYDALMSAVKKIALHLRQVTGYAYVGSAIVGTDVPHAHVHLVPFDTTSQYYNLGRATGEPDFDALAATSEKLKFSD